MWFPWVLWYSPDSLTEGSNPAKAVSCSGRLKRLMSSISAKITLAIYGEIPGQESRYLISSISWLIWIILSFTSVICLMIRSKLSKIIFNCQPVAWLRKPWPKELSRAEIMSLALLGPILWREVLTIWRINCSEFKLFKKYSLMILIGVAKKMLWK